MKKLILTSILGLTVIYNSSLAQTPASCPCTGGANICATTAQELFDALNPVMPYSTPTIIEICGQINLGQLSYTDFPLIVPPDVTLRGDNALLGGTKIFMPFLYKHSKQCGNQTPSVTGRGDAEEQGDDKQIFSATYLQFTFKLMEGAAIEYISVEGPKTDTKEEYRSRLLDAHATCSSTDANREPKEGLVGGILMRGHNTD